jgi:hypothetical protein
MRVELEAVDGAEPFGERALRRVATPPTATWRTGAGRRSGGVRDPTRLPFYPRNQVKPDGTA